MTEDATAPTARPDAVPGATPDDPYGVPDGPHPHGSGIREDGPTLSGLPDDAPDELRATLSGGDPHHLPVEDDRTR
ncbi:hypothetical protein [Actinotalea solisilvae]|uniref:hypothetical protein n=1 Tax=Actinotalea solisilvae TaxID=2072922 RepID=UPI0018F24068|nr:hypothetical protein [Actinotalea solisilvae]